jgi:drug/metabolite transporter (DMT)-like permease
MIGWLLAAIGIALVGDVMIKKAADGAPIWLLYIALIPYSATVLPWYMLMRSQRLSVIAGVIYPVAQMLIHITLGVVFFGERMTAREWAAGAIALTALLVLGRG